MSNYNSLKANIDANIKQNGKREITGQILNSVLNQMVTTLGAGYQFAGVATPASNPGTPDAKVFYIANGKGMYTNFGGLDVTEDEVVILYLDSAWHKVSTGIALKSEIPDISDKADKATTLAGYGISNAYTKSEVDTTLEGKQDTIADLDDIREGAALGKTALQEHQDISKLATKEEVATKQDKISDLATIRSGAAKGATALQSYTETDPVYMADKPSLALKSEMPDISGKADKTLIVTETVGKSSYSIVPNRLTRLGTLASNVTLSLNTASEEAGVVNIYDIIFTTPTDAPSITWPEGISWEGGSAPSIAGGKTYEVSIMDNLAILGEY